MHSLAYEVIVVLNGADRSVVTELARSVEGATVKVSRVNRGFAGACNLGVAGARGDFVLLLNDDTVVEPDWLEYLVAAIEARPRAGAVGSRLLHANGALQEAGQVMWRDGSTTCVGRDRPAGDRAFEWARQVDYCSGSSLLIRRSTWNRAGGLDESFFPAYYEDVDLCLKIAESGEEVWYEPNSRVRHLESQSTTGSYKRFLIERNRPRLVARWGQVLDQRDPPDATNPEAVMDALFRAMGDPRRLLIIDDRIPIPALGAGFPRMYDFAHELAQTGTTHVAVLPTATDAGDAAPLAGAGIEIVREPLVDHLASPGVAYDLVVVSRPNNFVDHSRTLQSKLPGVPIVYDVEALFHRRMRKQIPFVEEPREQAVLAAEADKMERIETAIVSYADHVVCLSEDEAEFVRRTEPSEKVTVKLPLLHGIVPTERPYSERSGIIMVASWVAGSGSPNADGLCWFLDEVFPLLRRLVPWATVRASGANPPDELLQRERFGVTLEGHIPNLDDFYAGARVVIVPVRFGSGVKLKTIEALQYGVPVVATTVGAEGIDLHGSDAIAVTDDPAHFADTVAHLLTDDQAWQRAKLKIDALQAAWNESDAGGPSWVDIIYQLAKPTVATALDRSPEVAHAR